MMMAYIKAETCSCLDKLCKKKPLSSINITRCKYTVMYQSNTTRLYYVYYCTRASLSS